MDLSLYTAIDDFLYSVVGTSCLSRGIWLIRRGRRVGLLFLFPRRRVSRVESRGLSLDKCLISSDNVTSHVE